MPKNFIATLFVAIQVAACVGIPARVPDTARLPDFTLTDGRTLTDVFLDSEKSNHSLFLFYRTSVSIFDCKQIQSEVREVWSRFFRVEADRADARRAVVFPEDAAGRSQGFRYVRDDLIPWREENFCPCSGESRASEACP